MKSCSPAEMGPLVAGEEEFVLLACAVVEDETDAIPAPKGDFVEGNEENMPSKPIELSFFSFSLAGVFSPDPAALVFPDPPKIDLGPTLDPSGNAELGSLLGFDPVLPVPANGFGADADMGGNAALDSLTLGFTCSAMDEGIVSVLSSGLEA